MEKKRYLKWYNKVGYGSGDLAGNVVYCISIIIRNAVFDKYSRLKSGYYRNVDHGIKVI